MRKIYDKNELRFALLWIAIYVVAFSVSDDVSVSLGIAKSVTAPFSVLMTIIIYMWIKGEVWSLWLEGQRKRIFVFH